MRRPDPDDSHQLRLIPRRTRRPALEKCKGQLAVWEAIRDYKAAADGNSPAISEIMKRTGLSKTTIAAHILKLEQRGYLWRNHNDQLEIGGVYSPPDIE